MTYDTLIAEFVAAFPELADASRKELDRWHGEDPPVHVFFGFVLNPFLEQALAAVKNEALLRRLFDFLESMALCPDERVQEVLGVTVLKSLGDDRQRLKRARALMGSATRQMSHETEKGLGRE